MTILRVDAAAGVIHLPYASVPCLIGRAGACAAEDKREGDGRTPIGSWAIRGALFRPGRAAPPPRFALPWRWIDPADGWSDDPADPAYNRPVRHPHGFGAEHLWRADGAYDIVLALGWNDRPPRAGRGSAIFLHCIAASDVTEGCVAIDAAEMVRLLPMIGRDTEVVVAQA